MTSSTLKKMIESIEAEILETLAKCRFSDQNSRIMWLRTELEIYKKKLRSIRQ